MACSCILVSDSVPGDLKLRWWQGDIIRSKTRLPTAEFLLMFSSPSGLPGSQENGAFSQPPFKPLWIQLIQLTLEQHGFELCRSIYIWILFSCKHYSTTRSEVGWIPGCRTTDTEGLRIGSAYYKLWVDFPLCRGLAPLTSVLFKVNYIDKRHLSSHITTAITAWHFLQEAALYLLLGCCAHKHRDAVISRQLVSVIPSTVFSINPSDR